MKVKDYFEEFQDFDPEKTLPYMKKKIYGEYDKKIAEIKRIVSMRENLDSRAKLKRIQDVLNR